MDPSIVLIVIAGTSYIAVMLFASRKVAAGKGRWVWLRFATQLLIPVAVIYLGLRWSTSAPFIGLVVVALGVGWLAVAVRMLRRLSRRVSTARSRDEIGTAVVEPIMDFNLIFIGITLIGGLVVVVALIVYGVMQAVR